MSSINSRVLWIEGQKVDISGHLDYFDFKKGSDEHFLYTHAFSTKEAQEKISPLTNLQLLISNLYADEYQGQSVVDFINNNRENGTLENVPVLIYSTFVDNKELSQTPEPCLCSGDRLQRLDDISKIENVHFLSFHNSDDKTFYEAVQNLQR